jgi:hypothetical protein
MDDLRSRLLEAAVTQYGPISPTSTRNSLLECFTEEDSRLLFWFNDRSGNTRVLIRDRTR